MPFAYATFTLDCGTTAVRVDGTGVITREDAESVMKHTAPGGQYHGIPLLIDNRQVVRMDPEARSVFRLRYNPDIDYPWMAMVVPNAVIRVTVGFLLRTTGITTMKLFSSEPVAITWLDEQIRKDAAGKTTT